MLQRPPQLLAKPVRPPRPTPSQLNLIRHPELPPSKIFTKVKNSVRPDDPGANWQRDCGQLRRSANFVRRVPFRAFAENDRAGRLKMQTASRAGEAKGGTPRTPPRR